MFLNLKQILLIKSRIPTITNLATTFSLKKDIRFNTHQGSNLNKTLKRKLTFDVYGYSDWLKNDNILDEDSEL